ncbi:hypothetical protein THAOC_03600, partial [Thalassiosira oceanica]
NCTPLRSISESPNTGPPAFNGATDQKTLAGVSITDLDRQRPGWFPEGTSRTEKECPLVLWALGRYCNKKGTNRTRITRQENCQQAMTRNSYRLRVSIAIALLACGLLVLLLGERKIDRVGESSGASGASAFIRVSNASSPSTDSDRRRLSLSLPNGGCEITWPKQPPPGIPITYAASYPGCGARMTWNLVEALTGMWTGDDWNNNGRGKDVITVKTHYPQSNGILVDFDHEILSYLIGRAFVIIRNPMKSIPSFFNHIYEMRNHLPVHSERAPVEEWVKWRNAYLQIEIDEYKKFIM